MAQAHAQPKYMTLGEGGTAAALGLLAVGSIVIAARAYTPEYAFHAYLFAAGSVAAIFAITNRYFERSPDPASSTASRTTTWVRSSSRRSRRCSGASPDSQSACG